MGLPAVGKSTVARKMAKDDNYLIIDIDKIVTMIHSDYRLYNDDIQPIYKAMEMSMIQIALLAGESVVLDRCCNLIATRKRWCDIGHQLGALTSRIYIETKEPIEERATRRFLEDNRGYSREKWIKVMKEREALFKYPLDTEGFDFVNIIESPHHGNQ